MGDIWFLMFDLKLLRYHLSSLGRKLCTDGGLWNVAKCIETSRAKFLPSFILIFIASFLEGGFILTFIQFLWSVESNFVCILPFVSRCWLRPEIKAAFITKLINIQKRKLFAAELPMKIAGNPTSQDLSQDVEEQDLNISPVCCCCFRTCQICHIYYRNWMEIWSDADVDNTVYFVLDANSQTKPNECQDSFSSFFCELDRCTKMIEHL